MTFLKEKIHYNKFKLIQETNPSVQEGDTSTSSPAAGKINSVNWTDINYTSISYTPPLNSRFVVYTCKIFGKTYPTYGNMYIKLLKSDDGGSTWADYNENTEVFLGSAAPYPTTDSQTGAWQEGSRLKYRGVWSIKFCLDSSNWTSERYLKLQGKNYPLHGPRIDLNKLTYYFGSSGQESGIFYYNPTVSCESFA